MRHLTDPTDLTELEREELEQEQSRVNILSSRLDELHTRLVETQYQIAQVEKLFDQAIANINRLSGEEEF